MKKIAVEASLVNGSQPTGFGVYANKLLEGLAEFAPDDYSFVLLYSQKRWNGPDYGARFEPVSYHFSDRQSLAISFYLNRVLRRIRPALFHVTCSTGAPPRCPVPLISTVHDIYPLTHGEGVSFANRFFFRILFPWTVRNSGIILCNSEFTKSELVKIGTSPEKIRVVYPASQLDFSTPSQNVVPSRKPYFLCVGAIEARKGQALLAGAYRDALQKNPSLPELLFIGPDRGNGHLLERYGVDSGIRWIPYACGEELKEYYRNASLFLCPSSFEGFGIPVLEALSAGIPVICSDLRVFHEIAGNCACYVSPEREAFSRALLDFMERRIIFDIGNGKRLAEKFSWKNNVEQTLDCYREMLEK